MGLGANTYGTIAQLQALIGDIVASRTFTTGTVPTLAQAEAEMDNAAMDLNRELEVAGYTVPVVNADYPTAYGFLAASNNYGAAAVLLGTLPHITYEEDGEKPAVSRSQMYHNKFKHALKQIREHKIIAAMSRERMRNIYCGAQQNADGDDTLPIFTRDETNNPNLASELVD